MFIENGIELQYVPHTNIYLITVELYTNIIFRRLGWFCRFLSLKKVFPFPLLPSDSAAQGVLVGFVSIIPMMLGALMEDFCHDLSQLFTNGLN